MERRCGVLEFPQGIGIHSRCARGAREEARQSVEGKSENEEERDKRRPKGPK